MSEEKEIIEAVEKAKKPGTFKIMDVLQERSFPTEEVEVYLNEAVAYLAAQIDEKIEAIDKKMAKLEEGSPDLKKLSKERASILEEKEKALDEIDDSSFTFHLTGISEGKREDLYALCLKEYPMEYETERNVFTAQSEKKEIDNPDRDRYFTTLLWQACISKIVDSDGNEQEGITFDEAAELRRSLPFAATAKITSAVEKLRTATAVFLMTVNEDFLAKSSPGTTTDGSKPS